MAARASRERNTLFMNRRRLNGAIAARAPLASAGRRARRAASLAILLGALIAVTGAADAEQGAPGLPEDAPDTRSPAAGTASPAAGASKEATSTADANAALWTRLAALKQAQGRFEQVLYSERGELLERSSGRYALLKPGFLRWEIERPDRQRLIVAEGQIWHYDIDLATATRRSLRRGETFSALDLLTADAASLRPRFQVEGPGDNSAENSGDKRYRLRPLFPGAEFVALELVWRDGRLRAMSIRDRSARRIHLTLTPDPAAPTLQPGDFAFEPPPEVEVFAGDP